LDTLYLTTSPTNHIYVLLDDMEVLLPYGGTRKARNHLFKSSSEHLNKVQRGEFSGGRKPRERSWPVKLILLS
jgi:hypothetical protein